MTEFKNKTDFYNYLKNRTSNVLSNHIVNFRMSFKGVGALKCSQKNDFIYLSKDEEIENSTKCAIMKDFVNKYNEGPENGSKNNIYNII